ncbi:isoprenylcysteine carboxylmethyltransferase family protein [Saccharophagus degradans]|uniref:methyltransferase family protein n=1 Tax=Saccharophagus degradans TaxID=86304 RepID=UPI001C094199|nr:isoprenylcysteine carboxylmethyltransferase family protein [Saccharophagus degradans]
MFKSSILKRNAVPPLFWVLAFCLLIELCFHIPLFCPVNLTLFIPSVALYIASLSIALVGASVILAGAYLFKKHQTTVNPMHPERSSALVQTGVYRFTRNPMYLGMLLIILVYLLLRFSFVGLVLPIVFVFLMTHMQIKPEEEMLAKLFGDTYLQYLQRVRRWL